MSGVTEKHSGQVGEASFPVEHESANYPLITLLGPTGVGKTTAARILSGRLAIHLQEERVLDLEAVYGKKVSKLDVQISYLDQKVAMIKSASGHPGPALVEPDCLMDVHAYARNQLSGEEFQTYLRYHRKVTRDLPYPDFVIHLTARPEKVMARIRARARRDSDRLDELQAEASYWDAVRFSCDQIAYWYRAVGIPCVSFDTTDLDIRMPSDADRFTHWTQESIKKCLYDSGVSPHHC